MKITYFRCFVLDGIILVVDNFFVAVFLRQLISGKFFLEVVDCLLNSSLQFDLRFPVKNLFCERNVRPSTFGVVLDGGLVHDLARTADLCNQSLYTLTGLQRQPTKSNKNVNYILCTYNPFKKLFNPLVSPGFVCHVCFIVFNFPSNF